MKMQPSLDIVRAVGQQLKAQFATQEPIVETVAMVKAFRQIDGEASAAMRHSLAEHYPDIGWLAGELDGADIWQGADSGRFWVCDALDGAVQFLRGIPHWCVSLTLVENGRATAAIVCDPMHDEMYHAASQAGAWCNGKRLNVNARKSHHGALLATSQPPFSNKNDYVVNGSASSLRMALREAGAVRNLGPTSLQIAYVASGRLDGFWEYGEDTYNCLGGALMVTEANGVATNVLGQPYGPGSTSIIVASDTVHRTLRESLATAN